MTNFTNSTAAETEFLQGLPIPPPGQIRELLRLHLPPLAPLSSTLSAITNELARYDAEIAELKTRLEQLAIERAAFQARYSDYTGLLAPIRRLPSELLVDIFGLCGDSSPTITDFNGVFAPLHTELARLAHAPILTLSQVCARWHGIALGTPALWARIDLEGALWTAPHRFEDIISLLRSVLERSADHSLSVTVTSEGGTSIHAPALDLLVHHSHRWREAQFICPFSDLAHLSRLENKLPRLRHLELFCWGDDGVLGFNIFKNAPRLKRVDFSGNTEIIGSASILPLEQLTELRCVECIVDVAPAILGLINRLSQSATLYLQLSGQELEDGVDFTVDGPPVTSHLAVLVLELCDFVPTFAGRTLEKVLAYMILPSVTEIMFVNVGDDPLPPLPWPHSAFISLSQRSSFHAHLHRLDLQKVVLLEGELLESLAGLSALKDLSIADHPSLSLSGSVEHVLITDTLLAALTRPTDSLGLVPELEMLECSSILCFDDSVLLDCVTSRLDGTRRFTCQLGWLPGHARDINAAVYARIGELSAQSNLAFSFLPAP
ncbi:hypothetical protein B0H16DRAFT_1549223 [Mycena metata]|uniref:F-box domain-containing protein n=1 Tax=Mycena metata TaxID=1033252 RepID=A0AAD7N9D8_9AGAR|nr:hypothetical protein B0H16DRAFT_1549223 [Mycena metata]